MNRRMRRSLWLWLAVFLATLAAGCGSDDGGPPAAATTGNGVVSAMVSSAGGSLELTTSGNARVTLTIPADALLVPITVTLEETAATTGAVATFTIEPAGTMLREPATLTITLPAALDPGGSLGAWFGAPANHTAMPGSYDAGAHSFTFQTWFLGYSAVAAAARPAAAGATGMDEVRKAADPPSGSDFINAGAMSCDIELTSLGERIERARLFSFSADSVSQLISQFEVTRSLCEAQNNDDYRAQAELLKTMSCNEYKAATLRAQVMVGAASADELAEQLKPVIGTAALVTATGAACSDAPGLDGVLAPEFSDFVSSYTAEVSAPGYLASAQTWRHAWGQLVRAVSIAATAQTLGLEQGEQQVYEELLPAMLDQLRGAAYGACRSEFNEERYLADIHTGGWLFAHPVVGEPELPPWAAFSAADLQRDIQYCGARLNARAYESGADVPMDERNLGGGDMPGTHITADTLRVPADGAIDLLGPINDFTCTSGSGSGVPENATVSIFANDHLLGTTALRGAALQTVPFAVSVGAALRSLGLPEELGQQFQLRVVRNGNGCGGSHGGGSFELFQISVTTDTPMAQIAGTWHGAWSGTNTETGNDVGGSWQGNFTQDGSQLGGSLMIIITVGGSDNCGGSIAGIVSGDSFQFGTGNACGGFTWHGQYDEDEDGSDRSLSGTWNQGAGTGAFWGTPGALPPDPDE